MQQGEKLEADGKLRPALAKYRFRRQPARPTHPDRPQLAAAHRQLPGPQDDRGHPEAGGKTLAATAGRSRPDTSAAAPPAHFQSRRRAAATERPAARWPGTTICRCRMTPRPATRLPARATALPPTAQAGAITTDRADRRSGQQARPDAEGVQSRVGRADAAHKDKQDALRQKDDVEFQLHSATSGVKAAQARFERTKADRDDLQAQVDKLEARLKEHSGQKPGAPPKAARKCGRRSPMLKKALRKPKRTATRPPRNATRSTPRSRKARSATARLTKERDAAVGQGESTKDAAKKIEALQTENDSAHARNSPRPRHPSRELTGESAQEEGGTRRDAKGVDLARRPSSPPAATRTTNRRHDHHRTARAARRQRAASRRDESPPARPARISRA